MYCRPVLHILNLQVAYGANCPKSSRFLSHHHPGITRIAGATWQEHFFRFYQCLKPDERKFLSTNAKILMHQLWWKRGKTLTQFTPHLLLLVISKTKKEIVISINHDILDYCFQHLFFLPFSIVSILCGPNC